jgi:hypothetical protein
MLFFIQKNIFKTKNYKQKHNYGANRLRSQAPFSSFV